MPQNNPNDAIPQGTVVRLSDGLAVVGDGPDLDDQYRVVRLFSHYSGPGFISDEYLTEIVGRILPSGEFEPVS